MDGFPSKPFRFENFTLQIPFHISDLDSDSPGASREAEFLRGLGASYRDICAAVLSIVGNRTDADDVVQEVCVLLWQRYEEFESGTNFRKWACAFAFNIAKAHVRRRRRQLGYGLSDQALIRLARLQEAGSELFELRREVMRDCVEKLREKDRRFLMRCYGRQTTLVEYARSTKTPLDSLYTRLKRLRRQVVDCVHRTLKRDELE